jgi:phosphonate transport system ATP-binding protein
LQIALEQITVAHPAAPKGAAALHEFSIQIDAGEQVAVIGPSGAGKTTLLYALACALEPLRGQIRLSNKNPWQLSGPQLKQLRGQLMLAPQVPPLPPRQRVVTAVLAGKLPDWSLAQSLRSLLYPVDIPAATAALAQFDLAEKVFDRVDRLSGGERQRVALARLMVSQAQLWLVDEPLSALDPNRAEQVMQQLTQQSQTRGATFVCTLHQVEKALQYFPRILGLRDGRLSFDLPSAQVTPAILAQLYASHEDQLHGTTAPISPPNDPSVPIVMHCR